ncbi:MAG: farnesyl diphosphate synthase [bacterium]
MVDNQKNFDIFISNARSFIDHNLEEYIKKFVGENISKSMIYSINAGGKRFRPLLVLLTYQSLNQKNTNSTDFDEDDFKDILPFIVAIEFIHTYSLIHDDLPCMDDDDFRRGVPTCHKAFDEAIAVLTGDALLNTAFEVMLSKLELDFKKKNLLATQEITKSAGSNGMIDGQVIDMYNQDLNEQDLDVNNQDLNILEEILLKMYKNKTGELISASIAVGAIMTGLEDDKISEFKKIGYNLGLAFQIKDDILDITGDERIIGKPINSDIKNEKLTYIKLHGLENSKLVYNNLCEEVLKDLKKLGLYNTYLYYYIKKSFSRNL